MGLLFASGKGGRPLSGLFGRPAGVIARLVAGIALLICAGTAGAASISGVVTDASTTLRLSSMVVRVYAATGEDIGVLTTTDSNGRYVLGLPSGDYRILAYDLNGVYATSFAGDAESFETSSVLKAAADVNNYNFALRPGGTVTGRVLSSSGPISQAVVAAYNLSGTRRGFTTADAKGNYTIVLPAGTYKLVAFDSTNQFAPLFYRFASSFDSALPVDVVERRAVAAVDFVLPRAGRLTGFVVDADTGAPVAGMLVSVYGDDGALVAWQQMKADQFDLAVEPGSYRLVVADITHQYAPSFFGGAASFNESELVSVGAGELRAGLRFEVGPAGHVSGRAWNASGDSLANITVAAYNVDGSLRTSGRTGTSGEFQIDLPPGVFKLVAFDEALVYAPQFYAAAADFRSATEVTIAAGEDVPAEFRMEVGGNFAGVAKDAGTNAPLAGITVAAYNSTGDLIASATTDSAGEYRLVVPAGTYRLAAFDTALRYAAGYAGGATAFEPSVETTVVAGSVADIDFSLMTGIFFFGSVIDAAQRSITGVDVAVLDPSGNRVATARSLNGGFNVVLLPGTYKLLAVDPQQRYLFSFFNGAQTLAAATPLQISRDSPPPSVTFILARATRRRAAGH